MRAPNFAQVAFASLFVGVLGVGGLGGCGPDPRNTGPSCTSLCTALGFQQCHEDGSFEPPVACGSDEVCDPRAGCVVCVPDELYCAGPTRERHLPLQRRGHRRLARRVVPGRQRVLGRPVQDPVRGRRGQPVQRRLRLLGRGPRQRVVDHVRDHQRRGRPAVRDRRREQQRLPRDGQRQDQHGARSASR